MGNQSENEEEMTVELELEDGSKITCAIVTILTVQNQDYIALLPLNEKGENTEGEVWFYRYHEDENNPDTYFATMGCRTLIAFDEYLDNAEFDELVDASE